MDRAPEESYTVQEAARILRTTERTVRRRLERGDLEGTRDPTTGRWRVKAHSVTAAMPDRMVKAMQAIAAMTSASPEFMRFLDAMMSKDFDYRNKMGANPV